MDLETYALELEIAVKAVHMACLLCRRVQESLILKSNFHDDESPVTVADWSVQATIIWVLSQSKITSILPKQDVESLSNPNSLTLNLITETVNNSLIEAAKFGIKPPPTPLTTSQILDSISRRNSSGEPAGRFWILNPLDGTLGFTRGDQFAVALALIDDGEPIIGVIGCPNYPMKKELLSYQNGYIRIVSRLMPASSGRGCVVYARRGSGAAWMQPLLEKEEKFVWPNAAREIKTSTIDNPDLATLCEPFERANSSHSFTAGLAYTYSVGMRNQPLRLYSMVKYAAIARGDVEIFMKFVNKEKISAHAAGVVIVQEAGGVVTDVGGHRLCFSRGLYFEGLDRGIIASSGATLHDKIIRGVDASWNSSCL